MSTLGHQTDVEYLPEGPYDLQDIGRKPVARIALRPNPAAQRDALADYVFQRQTNRRPYSGPLLSDDDEAERVRAQLPPDTAELLVRNRPQDMRPLLDVFYRAMEIEVTTPRTWEETRIWFRYDERRRRARRDGLSAAQAGLDGIRRRLMEAYLRNGDPTRWFSARSSSSFLKGIREGVDSARGVLLLKTPTNRQLDWLLAGRAFARVHLALTQLGLTCQPYSQVLQESPPRWWGCRPSSTGCSACGSPQGSRWPSASAVPSQPTSPRAGIHRTS